jgi:hypothetical protein
MNQSFFIEGRYHGTVPRQSVWIDRTACGPPLSYLYYCAECGEVFARAPVDTPSQTWQAVFGCCRQCTPRSGMLVPGSVWYHDEDLTAAFPDAVLRWELERHLDWKEKEYAN